MMQEGANILLRTEDSCRNNSCNGQFKVCCDCSCIKRPLTCNSCNSSKACNNQSHLKTLADFVSQFSSEISRSTTDSLDLFQRFSENEKFLKSLYDNNSFHIQKMEDHVIAQKRLIAEDIAELMGTVSEVIQQIKNECMKKIDDFFLNYKSAHEKFKENLASSFSLLKYRFLGNPNNLAAKLYRFKGEALADFVSDLKSSIEKSKEIIANKEFFMNNVKSAGENLLNCSQNLPVYSPLQTVSNQADEFKLTLRNFFSKSLTFPSLSVPQANNAARQMRSYSIASEKENYNSQISGKRPSSKLANRYNTEKDIQRSRSRSQTRPVSQQSSSSGNSNFAISSEGKHLLAKNLPNELRLRVTGSFRVPDSIESAVFVNSKTVAYLGNSTKYLRILDLESGKVLEEGLHNENVNTILCLQTSEKNPTNFQSERSLIITTANDKEAYVWSYEKSLSLISKFPIGSIITCSTYLKDRENIICGDSTGNLVVLNFVKSRIFARLETSHKEKIVDLKLCKNGQKLVVASRDNAISIWAVNYTALGAVTTLDSVFCSKICVDNFQEISSIGIPFEESDIVVITNRKGNIVLFDLQKRIFLSQINAHTSEIPETILLCENNGNEKSFVIITSSLSDKGLKFWGCFLKKSGEFDGPLELASFAEMNISGSDSMKNKISMTKGNNPKLMVVNGLMNEISIGEIVFN